MVTITYIHYRLRMLPFYGHKLVSQAFKGVNSDFYDSTWI